MADIVNIIQTQEIGLAAYLLAQGGTLLNTDKIPNSSRISFSVESGYEANQVCEDYFAGKCVCDVRLFDQKVAYLRELIRIKQFSKGR